MCCSGLENKACTCGLMELARRQLKLVKCRCCSGSELRTRHAHGVKRLVKRQQQEAICMFCSGSELKTRLAHGVHGLAELQPKEAT